MGALEAVRRRKARPILVVDDDSAIRDSERQVLADNGFRVVEAKAKGRRGWLVEKVAKVVPPLPPLSDPSRDAE